MLWLRLFFVILVIWCSLFLGEVPIAKWSVEDFDHQIFAKFIVLCIVSSLDRSPVLGARPPLCLCTSVLILFFCMHVLILNGYHDCRNTSFYLHSSYMLVSNSYHDHGNKSFYLHSSTTLGNGQCCYKIWIIASRFLSFANSLMQPLFFSGEMEGVVWGF